MEHDNLTLLVIIAEPYLRQTRISPLKCVSLIVLNLNLMNKVIGWK